MRLVPFGPEHLDALRAFIRDPEIQRFTRIPVPTPDDFPDTWLATYERAREDGSREAFAALDGEQLVGLGLLPTIDRDAAEAELGYIVAPGHRGRGLGAAILRDLTAWAFAHGVERCELYIDVRNAASEAVARRAGYTREGLLRSVHLKADERVDVTVWSRLPADPAP